MSAALLDLEDWKLNCGAAHPPICYMDARSQL